MLILSLRYEDLKNVSSLYITNDENCTEAGPQYNSHPSRVVPLDLSLLLEMNSREANSENSDTTSTVTQITSPLHNTSIATDHTRNTNWPVVARLIR